MSVILVGEVTNPRGLDPRYALTGRSGQHLARLAGLDTANYLRLKRFNIDPTGTADQATRHATAKAIENQAQPGDAIVMLGREVQEAFGFGRDLVPFTRATTDRGVVLITFPHPSPRNRYWSGPAAEKEAAGYLQTVITEFKGDARGN